VVAELRKLPMLLVFILLAISPSSAPRADAGYSAYIPVLSLTRSPWGFHVADFAIAQQAANIALHKPDYIRIDFGDWNGAPNHELSTPYQQYLLSGWPAVDAEVIPRLDIANQLAENVIIDTLRGGPCPYAPAQADLEAYADFLAAFAARYDFDILEPWNEPDYEGGMPGIFGCFGSQYADEFIDFLEYLLPLLPPSVKLGISFGFSDPASQAMFVAAGNVAGLEYVGIHNYGIHAVPEPLYPWPGDLKTAYELATSLTEKPVWITEYNLRDPSLNCLDPVFQQAQADVVNSAFSLRAPVVIPFSYHTQLGSWDCVGLHQSQWERMALGVGYP